MPRKSKSNVVPITEQVKPVEETPIVQEGLEGAAQVDPAQAAQLAQDALKALVTGISRDVAENIMAITNAVTMLLLHERLGLNRTAILSFADNLIAEVQHYIAGERSVEDLFARVKTELDAEIIKGDRQDGQE